MKDKKEIISKLVKTITILIAVYCINLFLSYPCEAIVAGRIEIQGLSSISREEFLDMFGISEGGQADEDTVKNGIKRAFLKGIFEDISVRVSGGENPLILISVRERDFIRKIIIKGRSPVPDKILKEHLILKEEQVMRYDMTETAIEALTKNLSYYGFPDAKIDIRVDKTNKLYLVDLTVAIDPGQPLLIREIKIKGPDAQMPLSLKLASGDIFNQQVLQKELKRIREDFRKQGYFNPSVDLRSFDNGILTINIEPGKKMTMEVEGNSMLSAKNLLKEISFFELGIFTDEAVADAVDGMLSLYHKNGYAFAQIAPVIEYGDKNIHIKFFVFEGEKVKVRSIMFNGANLPEKRLKEVVLLKENEAYNPDYLEKDVESLKEFYMALGFLDVNIKGTEVGLSEDGKTVGLTFNIDEDAKVEISSVDITGVPLEMKEQLMPLLQIKAGDPYNEVDISDARFRVLDYYGNLGYTNIDIIVTRSVEKNRAAIVFQVVEGKKKLLGKTIITGNKQTKYHIIKRELLNKEGQPYNLRTIADERQRLYKLGLFTEVEIETINLDGDKNDLLIKIREGNAGSVEVGFGYAEYERFRGFFEMGYRNLWGMNRQGLLRAEMSSLERRYILQYQEPWFMGIPLPFRAFFLYENKEEINTASRETRYKLQRYTVTAGVEKKLSNTLKAELYYEFSHVKTSDVQPDVILSKDDFGTLAISSLRPGLIYDTRDSPIDPGKGILAGISLKLASPLLLSQSDFAKFVVYASTFHKLTRRVTFAASLRGGAAYSFKNTEELPIVERFFLGGRSSVRGYEQDTLGPKGVDNNPTGGNAFLMGNLELRASIGRGFGLVPFLDAGNVWIKTKDIDPADLKYTTGIGLRYETPVGPLRVDYGIKLNKGPHESKSAVHFSIGHAF